MYPALKITESLITWYAEGNVTLKFPSVPHGNGSIPTAYVGILINHVHSFPQVETLFPLLTGAVYLFIYLVFLPCSIFDCISWDGPTPQPDPLVG